MIPFMTFGDHFNFHLLNPKFTCPRIYLIYNGHHQLEDVGVKARKGFRILRIIP